MPTPDPSVVPYIVAQTTGIFTANWLVFLQGAVGLLVAISLPLAVAKGGLRKAIGGLKSLFGRR